MATRPDSRVTILDWTGMKSNSSPHLIDKGESQVQVNIGDVAEGRNDVRQGYRALTFDN